MYRMQVFKYYRPYEPKTGKINVLSHLLMETTKPINVRHYKKSIAIVYADDKFVTVYTIPIPFYEFLKKEEMISL